MIIFNHQSEKAILLSHLSLLFYYQMIMLIKQEMSSSAINAMHDNMVNIRLHKYVASASNNLVPRNRIPAIRNFFHYAMNGTSKDHGEWVRRKK
jgi:hypothetical protein